MTDREGNKKNIDLSLMKRLLPYIAKFRWLVLVSFSLLLLFNISTVIQPYLVKKGIDKNIMEGDIKGLLNTVILLFAVVIIGLSTNFFFNYLVQFLGQKILMNLRLDLYSKVLKLQKSFFDKTPVGSTLTNVTNDVEAIRAFVSEGVVTVVSELLKVFFILVAMFIVNYRLAIITILSIPIFVIGTMMFRNSIRIGFAGVRKANSGINISLVETITGIKEIILLGLGEKRKKDFETSNREYLNAYLKVINAYSLYFPIIELVSNISMIIVFFYSHFIIGFSVHVGEIFAFFLYINMFFRPLRELAEKFNMFQSAMAASERAFKLLDEKIKTKNPEKSLSLHGRIEGRIEFQNVNFCYDKNSRILEDISFSIEKGEKVAIIGDTGSGKTTIINLINRIYDLDDGSIFLDGKNIKQYDLKFLRQNIGVVPQEPFFFNGTIFENLTLFRKDIDRNIVINAAKKVHLHSAVKSFNLSYEENIFEEGKKLSSGQRQLVSFARALIKDPPVIILDEATSNIDSETEKYIEDATEKIMSEKTSIIIAHRLSTIKMCDRILVIRKGKLVEMGNHRELIKKRGVYYKLHRIQAFSLN